MNYNIMVLLCFFADICRASFDHLSNAKEINNATFEVDLFRRQLSSQNQEAMLEGSYESTPPIFNHPFCNQMINSRKLCTEAEYSASVENNVHPVAQPLKILPEQIKAYDQTNRNATIQYYFVNGEPSTYGNYFTINPRTGAVFQTKPIPRHRALAAFPRNKPFVLKPGAFQVTLPGGQKNLYPPVLQVTGVKGYIEENAKVGSIVRIGENFDSRPMQILVTDQDLLPNCWFLSFTPNF
uniref:Cadherin domain-containing protein n=1 Tax=Romanomermis culicivorax TaxID=13658 RepID=A0A915ISG4_ROMCU